MARTDDVMQQVRAYSDALGSTLTVLERLSAWVRGLRDPRTRAMRLRHRSARLLRAAKRAAAP